MKQLIVISFALTALAACSAAPVQGLCYKNKMYYPNDSKICGDIKLIKVKKGGVNYGMGYVNL